jgi:hypothetical protein
VKERLDKEAKAAKTVCKLVVDALKKVVPAIGDVLLVQRPQQRLSNMISLPSTIISASSGGEETDECMQLEIEGGKLLGAVLKRRSTQQRPWIGPTERQPPSLSC